MDRTNHIASSAFAGARVPVPPVFARGVLQSPNPVEIDLIPPACGDRPSEAAGSTVMNEVNEVLGTTNDLILAPGHTVPFAIISVGGGPGVDTKLVLVPYSAFRVVDKHIILPGATTASLKALPSFKYAI